MEFLPSEIARLVLGYLDDEKCDQAYDAFLTSSEHLTECVKMKKIGRNFSTKVLRLNLCDILDEYAAVYSLVEERLSKVDPETFNRLTMQGTLLDKLTFLLNGTGSGQTVLFSITVPPGKSPQTSAVAHARKKLRFCSTSKRRKVTRLDTSKSSSLNDLEDNMSLNVETTALSSLPGNIKQRAVTFNDNVEESFDQIHKTPRRRSQTLPPKRTRYNADDDEESNIDSADLDAITQAFVDHELHQKIAKNINKIIYTSDLSNSSKTSASKDSMQITPATDPTNNGANSLFSVQLDNAIKKVVQQTESDPYFEHFLQEILEHGADEAGNASYSNQAVFTPALPSVDEAVKHSHGRSRLRNIRLKSVDGSARLCEEIASEIDHENSVAIQNIISINSEDRVSTPAVKENFPLRRSVSASSVDNITAAQMFNEFNPMEQSYSPAISTASTSEVTANLTTPAAYPEPTKIPVPISASMNINNEPVEINSVPVVSSTNVMVVGPQNLKSQPQIIMAEPFQTIMADNRFYLINSNKGSGLLQPAYLSQQTIISENDMTKIPVIMCDEPSSSYVMTKKSPAPRIISKIMPKILQPNPKDTIKISTSIQETESMNYYVNIQAEPKSLSVSSTTKTVTPTASDSGSTVDVTTVVGSPVSTTSVVSTAVTTSVSTAMTTSISTAMTTSISTAMTTSISTAATTAVSTARSVPLISLSSEKKNPAEEICLTPLQSTSALEVRSTSSSKSHIRALDFSTPPKKHGSAHKFSSAVKFASANKSSSPRREKLAKTGKESVRSLFISPVKKPKIPIATKTPGLKLRGDWSGNDLIFQDDKDDAKYISSDSVNDSLDGKGRTRRAAALKSPYGERVEVPVKYKFILDDSADKLLKDKERWDKDLRALVPDPPTPENKSPGKKPAKRSRSKSTNAAMNTTADVVSSIEAVLAKMEEECDAETGLNQASKKEKTSEEEKKKPEKTPSKPAKEKKAVEKKKPARPKNNTKETKASEKKSIKEDPNSRIEDKNEKLDKRKPSKRKAKQNTQASIKKEAIQEMKDVEEEEHLEQNEIRNMNPRLRKRCNVRSVLKPPVSQKFGPITEEEEKTPVTSPKALIQQTTEQLRRELEEDKLASETLSNIILTAPVITIEDFEDSYPSKITPDMSNKLLCKGPMLAKRNITPALETPMKSDNLLCPLTPNILTTYIDSPLNAMLNDNNSLPLEFSAIMTPNFPMTPSIIPITPNILSAGSIGSYASRPTDYSNSSSYYHPSDSEQGQKLEHVLIQEAMKMECFKSKTMRTSTPAKVITESIQTGNGEINISVNRTEEKNKTEVLRKGIIACSVLVEPLEDSSLPTNKSTADSVPSTSSDSSSCSSSCSSDCSTESDDITDVSECVNINKTVIHVPTLNSPTTNEKSKQSAKKSKSPAKKMKSNVTKEHADILNTMQEKRKRTIMMLKTEVANKSPHKKPRVLRNPKKNTTAIAVARGRLRILDESLPNNTDDHDLVQFVKKPLRTSKSLFKASIESVASKLLSTKKSDLEQSVKKGQSNSDTSLESGKYSLHSGDEEDIPRLHITSDEEDKYHNNEGKHSEDLVEGLKERGIHLIPIGTPNKNAPATADLSIKPNQGKKIDVKSVIVVKQGDQLKNEQTVIAEKILENTSIEPQLQESEGEKKLCDTEEEYCDSDYLVTTTINEDSEEFIEVQHAPSSKKYRKSLADYDFTILKDDVKASLIDDENRVQEFCLTVTPYIELLSMAVKRKRKPKPTKEEEETKKSSKLKTLNILYEEIQDSSSSSSEFEIKPSKIIKNCEVAGKTDIEKVSIKSALEEKSTKKVISLEDYKNKSRKTAAEPSTSKPTEPKIKEITINTDDENDTKLLDKDEDMLMTLALTGTDTSQDNTTRKRKMESNSSKQSAEKKLKKNSQHELLGMDLESFLNRVHGPSELSKS